MQSTWVDFIVGGVRDVRKNTALVYGKDRIARMESLCDDPEWMEQKRKFDLIAAHRREAAIVMKRIFALAK
jgi:hypothetical protein